MKEDSLLPTPPPPTRKPTVRCLTTAAFKRRSPPNLQRNCTQVPGHVPTPESTHVKDMELHFLFNRLKDKDICGCAVSVSHLELSKQPCPDKAVAVTSGLCINLTLMSTGGLPWPLLRGWTVRLIKMLDADLPFALIQLTPPTHLP